MERMRSMMLQSVLVGLLTSCGAEDPVYPPMTACVPGQVSECPCATETGRQVCNQRGTFDACQCPENRSDGGVVPKSDSSPRALPDSGEHCPTNCAALNFGQVKHICKACPGQGPTCEPDQPLHKYRFQHKGVGQSEYPFTCQPSANPVIRSKLFTVPKRKELLYQLAFETAQGRMSVTIRENAHVQPDGRTYSGKAVIEEKTSGDDEVLILGISGGAYCDNRDRHDVATDPPSLGSFTVSISGPERGARVDLDVQGYVNCKDGVWYPFNVTGRFTVMEFLENTR